MVLVIIITIIIITVAMEMIVIVTITYIVVKNLILFQVIDRHLSKYLSKFGLSYSSWIILKYIVPS